MKNVTILLAVVAMLTMAVPADGATRTWSNTGTGSWHTDGIGGNWGGDAEPVAGDEITIGDGGTAQISGTAYAKKISIKGGSTLETATSIYAMAFTEHIHVGYTGTGFFDQAGGSITGMNHLAVGVFGNGAYTISGGSFVQTASDYSFNVGKSGSGTGYVKVVGTGPTQIDVVEYDVVNSGSTLEVVPDDNGVNLTPINVVGTTSGRRDATLTNSTLVLDAGNYTAVTDEVITVLTMSGTGTLTTTGLTFTVVNGNQADWQLLTTDGVGGTIKVKSLVPEPATMVLLGIGGIGVLIRRRRRA